MPKSSTEHHGTPFSKKGLIIWGLASLFYFYDYLLQVSPGAMKPELVEAFALDAVDFGMLSALFHYAYGAMQIPAGMLLDKFGPRRVLTLACALSALGCFLFAKAETLFGANLSRFVMGLGASFALMGCFKVASIWFAKRHFAFITGSTITIGFMGAVVGLFALPHILTLTPWRNSMMLAAVLGAVGTIVIYWVIRDKASSDASSSPLLSPEVPKTLSNQTLLKGLLTILQSRAAWYAAIYSGLMFCPTLVFALWGVPFFVEAQSFDRQLASQMTAFLYLGWLFGAPFFGWISDKLGKRKLPLYYASLSTLFICIGLIYLESLPSLLIVTLLFTLGFFSSGFILSFVIIREMHHLNLAGTALGFANTINTLLATSFQPFIGMVLEWVSDPNQLTITGERLFNLNDYQNAFSAVLVAIAVAIGLLYFIPETGKGKGTAD